jgi:hypothetical protein
MSNEVKLSVYKRLDQPGFVLELKAKGRTQRFPTLNQKEAVLLAESIRDYVITGLPIDVLMGATA